MKMTADTQRDLHEAYPDIEFNLIQKCNFFHSTIYRLSAKAPSLEFPREVLLKKYRDTIFDAGYEYYFLDSFYRMNTDTIVSSPLPIMKNSDRHFILTGFVPGHTIKSRLLTLFPGTVSCADEYSDLSARALSRFHSFFIHPPGMESAINSPLFCSFGEDEIKRYTALVSECSMDMKVQAYIDFSPQNLITSDGKIFLIDFPDRECICTPHLDIARWKFNLMFLKQFPRFRFLKLSWWDEDLLFQRFVRTYCSEMNVTVNEKDMDLVDFFLGQYAKKLRSIYVQSSALMLKLQYFYLSGFLHSLTDPRATKGNPDD